MSVTVYSLPTSQCVKCRGVDIAMRGVDYTKIMLNEDPEALAFVQSLGYRSAPVTVMMSEGAVVDHWDDLRMDRIKALKGVA